MLSKYGILNILGKYQIDPNKVVIMSGASMVLHNIKEKTSDIDFSVSEEYEKFLLENYTCKVEKITPDGHKVWFLDGVLNFSTNHWGEFETEEIAGYQVQTLESIYELKKSLKRGKDKDDLDAIMKVLGKR